MLLLKCLVHATLLHFFGLTIPLLCHLLIKLSTDQSSALLLSHHGLLLLLVVQQRVELLNGSPLVLLSELRVDFRLAVNLA